MNTSLVELYYARFRGIVLHTLRSPTSGVILDLDSLSTDLKTVVIRWMIEVNRPRLDKGEPPIFTLEVALKCPVWRSISPPLVSVKLTPEGIFNKPNVKTRRKTPRIKSINK